MYLTGAMVHRLREDTGAREDFFFLGLEVAQQQRV